MSETAGYGPGESLYHTEQEQLRIAEIATRQGAIAASSLTMTGLFENYIRMVLQDARDDDMTMRHGAAANHDEDSLSMDADDNPELDAHALEIAHLALEIVQNGGEQSAEHYIGTGGAAHAKAIEYLPLVLQHRNTAQPPVMAAVAA